MVLLPVFDLSIWGSVIRHASKFIRLFGSIGVFREC